jgi:hypothetical protein
MWLTQTASSKKESPEPLTKRPVVTESFRWGLTSSCSVSHGCVSLEILVCPHRAYTFPRRSDPFNNWIGEGLFSPLFRTFLRSEIPSYYKIFLTAYLFSYTSGGAYILVFTIAAIARLVDREHEVSFFSSFNSAGVLILSIIVS